MYGESLWINTMDHVYTERLFLNQWLTASPALAAASPPPASVEGQNLKDLE